MNTRGVMTILVGWMLLLAVAGCSGTARMRPPCGATEAGFRPDASQAGQYPYSELRDDRALLVFVRPTRFSSEEAVEVLVNGRNAGMLRAKRYTLFHARPGGHTILARATGQEPVAFDMLVEPGKVYFVEVAPARRGVSARAQSHIISPEDGRRVLSLCELEGRAPGARQED